MEKLLKNGKMRAVFAIALVAIMFSTLLVVNLLTPPIRDDYLYSRSRGLFFGEETPVRSISDAFRFAMNMYNTHSGRVFTSFYYLFYSKLDKTSIALLNSLFYLLTVWLLYLLIRGRGKNSCCLFIAINLSLWVFVPELGQDIFWVCGTINYLVTMLPILGIILIYQRGYDAPTENDGMIKCGLMAILGLIAGWQFENSSIVVPFIALVYICLWKYKRVRVPKWAWFGFVGGALGFILLVIAPGNFQRNAYEIQSASLSIPFKFALITYYWIMFVGVLTALFIIGVIKCRRERLEAIICRGGYLPPRRLSQHIA